jgi:ribonuclease HII
VVTTTGANDAPPASGKRRPATADRRGPRATLPTLSEEQCLWDAGFERVVGIDEVGRGAWAGPVSVGAALLRPGTDATTLPTWLRDSKALSETRRELIFEEIGRWCVDWSVGHASAEECDELGMTAAVSLAGARAVAGLGAPPDAALVDGPRALVGPGDQPFPQVPVVGGDARCAAIAAASVLAKVTRDRMMRDEADHFPPYAFDRNKGYPSADHQRALRGYGLSSIHRRSWSYVGDLPWA